MMKSSSVLKALAAIAAGVLLFSCTKPKVTELSLSSMAANFDATGADGVTINVTSNEAWTVSKSADWVSVSPTSGNGNGSFTVTAQDNTGIDSRSTTLTVTAQDKSATVSVTQLGITPKLMITGDVSGKHVGHEGGTSTLEIKANVPWTATVLDDLDWVTVSPASGDGDATVSVTFAPNVLRKERKASVAFRESVGGTEKVAKFTQEMGPATRMTDSLALVAVYNASKGAEWTKGNWDLTQEMSTWKGVTLSKAGRVESLKLTTTVGIPEEWTLPEEIVDLTEMTDLRINKQKLTGEFPKILCTMNWVQILYLQGNNFTGALPAEIGQMTELTDLYVDQNATMSGSIPKEIGSLKKLQRLNISQSGIGGEIPVELGQCVELLQFMAFKSQLSGTIPDIWDLPKLQTFMVHTCPGLTGELPASLGKLKAIATAGPSIQVHSCNITGNIPESFALLDGGEKKVQVHVYGNKMTGVIPAAVQAHKDFSSWKINPQQDGYGLTTE